MKSITIPTLNSVARYNSYPRSTTGRRSEGVRRANTMDASKAKTIALKQYISSRAVEESSDVRFPRHHPAATAFYRTGLNIPWRALLRCSEVFSSGSLQLCFDRALRLWV